MRKRRILGLLTALALCLSLLPATALAVNEDFSLNLSTFDSVLAVTEGGKGEIMMWPQVYHKDYEEKLKESTTGKYGYEHEITSQAYTAAYKGQDGNYITLSNEVVYPKYGSGATLEFDLSKASNAFSTGTYTIQISGTISGTFTPNGGTTETYTLVNTTEFTLNVVPNITKLTLTAPESFTIDYAEVGKGKVYIPIKVVNQDNAEVTGVCEISAKISNDASPVMDLGVLDPAVSGYTYGYGILAFACDLLDVTQAYAVTFTATYADHSDSAIVKLTILNPGATAFAQITKNGVTTYYPGLTEAIAAAEEGDTIEVLRDVVVGQQLTIGNNITIKGTGKTITVLGADDYRDAGGTLKEDVYRPAIIVNAGGSLTLDGVAMNITGVPQDEEKGTYNCQAIRLYNATSADGTGAKLNLTNGAALTMSKLEAGIVFPGTPATPNQYASVNLNGGSTLTIETVDGNASNGGVWNIAGGSVVNISSCGSHGLSAESVNIDGATVNVRNVGFVGMIAKQIALENGGQAIVSGSGTKLPYPSTWSPNGVQYENAVEVKTNGSLSVDEKSALSLFNNVGSDGKSVNTIWAGGSNVNIQGTLVAEGIKGDAPFGSFTVTVKSDDQIIAVETVSNTYVLPAAPVKGIYYVFQGWLSSVDEKVYQAGDFVPISADTTFTAQWTYFVPTQPGAGSSSYNVSVASAANGKVAVSPTAAPAGTLVTVTATPDAGYELASLTVTAANGVQQTLTPLGNGKFTFTMPASAVTVAAVFQAEAPAAPTEPTAPAGWVNPYTDVAVNDWFYNAVGYASANGLMSGTSATTFSPDSPMSRAMVWTVLARAAGQTIAGENWAEAARTWAMAAGVSDGTNPDGTISREEIVTMLYRFVGEPDVTASDLGLMAKYADGEDVSAWAQNAMAWALSTGVINGRGDKLAAGEALTRAEAATMLGRCYLRMGK